MIYNPENCNTCPIKIYCDPENKGYVTQFQAIYAVCDIKEEE